jgi:hypothetical protein
MYASSSAKLLLHTPQRLNARGFALIDVLIGLTGREGPGGHDFFCDGSLQGRAALTAQAVAAEQQATDNSSC